MNVDGYALIAVNGNGKKAKLVNYYIFDIELREIFSDFVDENVDTIIDMNQVVAFEGDIKNKLMMVAFTYESKSYLIGGSTEFEDATNVQAVVFLNDNYKELWKNNLLTEYSFYSVKQMKELELMEPIQEWEKFYGEDFDYSKFAKEDAKPMDSSLL